MRAAVTDPLLGMVLDGRYRVEGPLARGGMSTVYRGTDLRLDRTVAVKVMAPSMARDAAFVDRFAREARAAARLSHVNVVAVHDQGADAGQIFLIMELIRGRTLRDLLREHGRLSPELAVAVSEPILAALSAAHRAGLIHRDVKPENVLLADDGIVKVADFGLARAMAETASTDSNIVMGTVAYVAPEQVTRSRTDPRTDVYSTGVVLFEMLTGAPPFAGSSALSIAYRHVHEDVLAPSTRVPGLPRELDAVVVRATRRRPDERPADASAFLAELHEARTALGLRRVPIPPRLSRAVQARPPESRPVRRQAARPAQPWAPPRMGSARTGSAQSGSPQSGSPQSGSPQSGSSQSPRPGPRQVNGSRPATAQPPPRRAEVPRNRTAPLAPPVGPVKSTVRTQNQRLPWQPTPPPRIPSAGQRPAARPDRPPMDFSKLPSSRDLRKHSRQAFLLATIFVLAVTFVIAFTAWRAGR